MKLRYDKTIWGQCFTSHKLLDTEAGTVKMKIIISGWFTLDQFHAGGNCPRGTDEL